MAYVGFLVVLVLGIVLLWCTAYLTWFELAMKNCDLRSWVVIGGIGLAGLGLLYWAITDAPFSITIT